MEASREYPARPMIGVGVVLWQGDRLLLVRRGKPPRAGQWSLPGGLQELGETTVEAALREVREETGVECRILGLVDIVDAIVPDANGRVRYHYTLLDFVAEWVSGEARADSDADAVAWIRRDEAAHYLEWSETLRIIDQSVTMRPTASRP
ncbi:Phosphatase NudJ [Oceanibacterium hippocampi]|uniref:Phosphatase NudJ n=2 Tax=Oceanibacterium hippocampi TaxID=745714 RepID=A0A1Y5RZ43_9PROT|nr:Phosphatase NudJ [Oceanibacterium hippocampi]